MNRGEKMSYSTGQGMGEYCVDIVMCIDATGSMAPILDEVKRNALSLYSLFIDGMEMENKAVDALRVKVIAFRDYICDTEPMVESKFFVLPNESAQLKAFLDKIEASGGGDTPECAFEAISIALKSDWTTEGSKRRHVIAVFTDAPALPLQERAGCQNYPRSIPKTMSEFSSWWEGTSQEFSGTYQKRAGRLIAFVPNDETWTQLESWNRFVPAYTGGRGCSELDMTTIIDTIVGSFDQ